MNEHIVLEKLVDSLLKLPKRSEDFANRINSKELISVKEGQNYAIGIPLKMPSFTKKFDESLLSIEPDKLNYVVSSKYNQELEKSSGEERIESLEILSESLYQLHGLELNALAYLKALYHPEDSSRGEYLSLFDDAVRSYKDFIKFYRQLKDNGIIMGAEPKLTVKLNVDDLIDGVIDYKKALESILGSLSNIKDDNSRDYNPQKLLKQYNRVMNHVQKVLDNYKVLKETGLIEKLKEGIDLLEPSNKKLGKAFASVVYRIFRK